MGKEEEVESEVIKMAQQEIDEIMKEIARRQKERKNAIKEEDVNGISKDQ